MQVIENLKVKEKVYKSEKDNSIVINKMLFEKHNSIVTRVIRKALFTIKAVFYSD